LSPDPLAVDGIQLNRGRNVHTN